MNKYRIIRNLILIMIVGLMIYSCGESGNNTQSLDY